MKYFSKDKPEEKKQSIIIISIILMAILTLLAGWRISQQDKTIKEIEKIVIELVKRQDTNKKNVEFLYKKMIEHEASIRLLKNGFKFNERR